MENTAKVSETPSFHRTSPGSQVRQAAQNLEAAFIAEMLKSAGLGQSRSEFGGGSGEDQFTSFLVRAQADSIAKAGGLGLSEMFIKSLMENGND